MTKQNFFSLFSLILVEEIWGMTFLILRNLLWKRKKKHILELRRITKPQPNIYDSYFLCAACSPLIIQPTHQKLFGLAFHSSVFFFFSLSLSMLCRKYCCSCAHLWFDTNKVWWNEYGSADVKNENQKRFGRAKIIVIQRITHIIQT